jgi:CheY-like chemotaxis protein
LNTRPGQITLLLIEDDDVEAERVARAFRQSGTTHSIRRALDGVEALDILRGNVPPPLSNRVVILLDLKMPRMDGIQFLDELRSDESLRQAIVFVLTTSENEQDRLRAYERHIAGYIVKTKCAASFAEVVAMVEAYCTLVDFPEGDKP